MSKNTKLILSISIIMIPMLFFGYRDQLGVMGIVLIASVIVVALINIDSFESFKVGEVFEAKMKEAKETIEEANATIEQLNSVAKPLLKANLTFLLYEGVFDGMPPDEQSKIFIELIKIKEGLGLQDVDEDIIKAAQGVASHYFSRIYQQVSKNHDEFRLKYHKYVTKYYGSETPSVLELETFFENNPIFLENGVDENFREFKEIKNNFID